MPEGDDLADPIEIHKRIRRNRIVLDPDEHYPIVDDQVIGLADFGDVELEGSPP